MIQTERVHRLGEAYYDHDYHEHLAEHDNYEELWSECHQFRRYKVGGRQFIKEHPEIQIGGFDVNMREQVKLTEYSPQIFKNIRRRYITEAQFCKSMKPCNNPQGIFQFKAGTGKSPSFFFFTDDNLLMVKTMKQSEFEILIEDEFLSSYYKYLVNNPGTLLMKIFGVFRVQIGTQKNITFLVTENMVSHDKNRIKSCFDLKGSIHGRHVHLTKKQ
mmetsp:Transcript_12777/g.21596  ORF Transcript_12777/g.21596 Transcript_12777/m.21596 type:complete len:216 (+) Transcript_12777:1159-1806(+)